MINVVTSDVDADMNDTMGNRLRRARLDAGLKTAAAAARRLGMSVSTYAAHENGQNEFGPDHGDKYGRAFGVRTAWLLTGEEPVARGGQPLDVAPAPSQTLPPADASFPIQMQFPSRMLPVFGQAAGGMNEDGRFILNGQKVADVFCPPALANVVGAYGVYMSGYSMSPRYEHGELLLIHPGLPISRGDYVLAQIHVDEGEPPYGYVKKFLSKNAKELVLEQLNPPEGQNRILRFPADQVIAIHRVFSAGLG